MDSEISPTLLKSKKLSTPFYLHKEDKHITSSIYRTYIYYVPILITRFEIDRNKYFQILGY